MIIQLLLSIMAVLTLSSGIVAFFGSQSKHRTDVFWHLVATIGAAIWSFSIVAFRALGEADMDIAPTVVSILYSSATILVLGITGHVSWPSRIGRVLTTIFCIAASALIVCICMRPDLLYSSITLGQDYNVVNLHGFNTFYIIYILYFILVIGTAVFFSINEIKKDKLAGHRINAQILFFLALTITSLSALVFDLILPVWNYSLIWIGSLAMAAGNLGFYYKLIRRRLTLFSTNWIINYSLLIVSALASMIYLVIFYWIFTALFQGQEPSPQVIILNFIMFLVVILSMPVFREITSALTSMVQVTKIDMGFVVKKLNALAGRPKNYQDVADFLADHMHFDYIGLIIDGKLYGSENIKMEKEEIKEISSIPPNKNLWQVPKGSTQMILNKYNINAVAPLGENKQILIGRPLGRQNLRKSDLAAIETIINLVTAIL